jgi:hypothetical protein
MEIPFRDVRLGEKFISRKTKRCFGAVKVAPTEVSSQGTVQARGGATYIGNAVILTDHVGKLAHDAGILVTMANERMVEVLRPKWPPISPGTTVMTTKPNLQKRNQWTDEGWAGRQWGVQGSVITHHDSHGLCYEVRHPDGTVGCYDPSELQIMK